MTGLILLVAVIGVIAISTVIQLVEMGRKTYESGKLTATEEASYELQRGGRR